MRTNDLPPSLVCVIDDDDVVRESIKLLVETIGASVRDYDNCLDFLADPAAAACACLILDVRLPGISGIKLQERLADRNYVPPIIFVSGHADVPTAVHAMRSGALDFLQKPFPEQQLLDRVSQAIEMSRGLLRDHARREVISARYGQLTVRERDVLDAMVRGLANKLIADELGISVKTVEQHRGRVMEKMRVRSLADLLHSMEWLRRGAGRP
jgi:FixJ family two-component response regulator